MVFGTVHLNRTVSIQKVDPQSCGSTPVISIAHARCSPAVSSSYELERIGRHATRFDIKGLASF
jgi:hypothetical protein